MGKRTERIEVLIGSTWTSKNWGGPNNKIPIRNFFPEIDGRPVTIQVCWQALIRRSIREISRDHVLRWEWVSTGVAHRGIELGGQNSFGKGMFFPSDVPTMPR
jgi:hypothetical protein